MEDKIGILIIDDSQADRYLLSKDVKMRFANVDITEAESAEEAFQLAEKNRFDIILLDYYLRTKDGLELLEQIQARKIETPIIVITGRGDERIAVEAIKRGAKDYLNKDLLTSERLEITIRSILQNQAREKEKSILEKRITEARIRYQTLFEDAREAIFICDQDGKLLDINPAGLTLFGYHDKKEILNKYFLSEISEAFGKNFMEKLTESDIFRDYELTMKTKSGEKIIALITISATKDESGRLTGFQGIIHDLTEKKRIEDELMQMQKLESLGTIAGTIAHDFNNIVSSILVNTEISAKYAAENKNLSESIRLIRESAMRASDLSRRLLSFAKKQEPDFHPVPIKNVINEVIDLIKSTADDHKITITLPDPEPEIIINGDRIQLGQLFLNLLINSIEAVSEGGKISVACRPLKPKEESEFDLAKDSYVLISVCDNGAGIDKKDLPNIFDPFFSTKHNKSMNVGLGLTSVMMIVKSHKGKMRINSEKEKGTEVRIAIKSLPSSK